MVRTMAIKSHHIEGDTPRRLAIDSLWQKFCDPMSNLYPAGWVEDLPERTKINRFVEYLLDHPEELAATIAKYSASK
jgi:hypothetical protein